MAKAKTIFYCKNCGNDSPKWLGKCPSCNEWNSYIEEVVQKDKPTSHSWNEGDTDIFRAVPKKLSEINEDKSYRIDTKDGELNRVLGGGIVPGSIVLIGGEPGVGKSTLMLQLALDLIESKVLYVTGEESEKQLKLRSNRLSDKGNDSLLILTETNTQKIFKHAKGVQPDLLIVDSIQTLYSNHIDSTPGSVSQLRECAAEMQRYAKESQTAVILIGHITKDGAIAGPKILEHIVDTVLQFEGDRNYSYRILRTSKNRFGSTSELGIYEMLSSGLKQVSNPSELLISNKDENLSGIAIAAMLEGMRPMLIEIQALVANAFYGTPQRSATGFDNRRLNMLLAVLEKRSGFNLANKDVFLNIAGGIRVTDPGIDLAIVVSLMSSYDDTDIDSGFCFAGEVGLSGEVRAVNRIDQRIQEAEKLGYDKIFISKYNKRSLDHKKLKIDVVEISKVFELYQQIFK